jgi:hypothetical protein
VADTTGESDSDGEVDGLKLRNVSSINSINNCEPRVRSGKDWKPFANVANCAMKPPPFRPRTLVMPQPLMRNGTPIKDALAVEPKPAQTTGRRWRWVERDIGDVLAELRKRR